MEVVEIKIGDQPIKVKTDNPEQLKQMASYVENKIQEVTNGRNDVNLRIALLTALNLAEEIHLQKEQYEQRIEQIRGKALNVKNHIETLKNKLNDNEIISE